MRRPLRERAAFRVAAAAGTALILAWSFGGQMTLGRIDPALALPWLALPALLLAWLQRHDTRPARRRLIVLTLAAILIAQALLASGLSARPPWLQLGLVACAWFVAAALADALVQWRRGRAPGLLFALLLVAGCFTGSHALLAALYRQPAASGPPATMLTGLPLRWSAGTDLSAMLAEGLNEDPALARLRAEGPLRLVDSLVDHPPPPGGTLVLAHPRALAPQELVAIDTYVRAGGQAVVLADALTGWPMRHPVGDPRNPPVTSLLTPLLDHWGVTLAAPDEVDRPAVPTDVDGARLTLFSPGRFTRLPQGCAAYADRRIARCPIGRGMVWLVGDADLLYAPLWRPQPDRAAHLRQADTMEWLAAHLWAAPQPLLQPLWIRAPAK